MRSLRVVCVFVLLRLFTCSEEILSIVAMLSVESVVYTPNDKVRTLLSSGISVGIRSSWSHICTYVGHILNMEMFLCT